MRATKLPSDSCLIRPRAAVRKDPGSAFGPESVPLATGLVPLSTGCPGPFQAQPPVQPDKRGKPFSLPVWLASPVLD
jgi:hypothetical protein